MNDFKLAISGGKGGVGKSMLASSLAILFNEEHDLTAIDCDVDVPNLAVWLNEVGEWEEVEEISVSERPVIKDSMESNQQCVEQCRFNAFEIEEGELKLNPLLCEGCGACQYFCPAVEKMEAVQSGWIKTKSTDYGFPLVIGQLKVGETGSGKIVTKIKKKADNYESEIQVIDSAPGTGCPVTAALQDVNFVVLVTEPTRSGFSDLERVKQVVDHFELEFGVVINRWDINKEITKEIEDWAAEKFLGKIDYDQKVVKAVSQMQPIMKTDLKAEQQIKRVFQKIKSEFNF